MQEAQQRALVAEKEARLARELANAATSRIGTFESYLGQFFSHYNNQAFMGCFCSKGVSANDSEKLLFGTDDVLVELHNETFTALRLTLCHSADKKLAEKSDLQLVHRHNKIGNVENFRIYHEEMSYNAHCSSYGTESVLFRAHWVSQLQEKQSSVRFEEKPRSKQEDILIYVYMMWHDLQKHSSVIEALKETNFVTSADEQSGDLYKPKELFDPGDSLLTSLFSDEAHKFPGKRFVSDGWLQILRTTGLQDTRDADILLKCAKKIEFLGAESLSNTTSEVSLEIWSMAETLMNAIIENFEVFKSNNFYKILGKIACVPAEKWFLFESGKKVVKRVLCSYSEAILLKDWPLAWCSAPIISKVPPEYSWGALQLMSPPPFTVVLKHLQDDRWLAKSCVFTTEEVSFHVLKYLDTIWGSLSSSDILALQQVAFIAADNGTRIVTSSSLFVSLTINISPLASKLPSGYLNFVKILKELGVEDMLSIPRAMNILSSLQKSCRHHRLNPNELRAVIELLHFLFNETIEHKETRRSNWESELVVPDDACRLAPANSCVYIDPCGSRYVKYIDTSKLRFVHHAVPERLCVAIGITKLCDAVFEELDHVENLQTLERIGSVSLAFIRLKLLSRPFQAAVSSVLYNFSSITSGSKNQDFSTLQRSLELVAERLKFVRCIYTRFWLLPKYLDITRTSKDSVIPEWESRSSTQGSLYYVDRSNTCMIIAEPPGYVSVTDIIALVVSHVLGSPVPLPIGPLFLCPQNSETAIVNILKLSSAERMMSTVGRGTDFLGRDVLPGDAVKLVSDPTRPFCKGEIVAWKSKNGGPLKYGRIPEDVIRPLPEQPFYTLRLESSPGKSETVLSSHVFSFKSFEIRYNISTYMMPEDGMHVKLLEEPRRVKLRNQRQATEEFERGRVSDDEFNKAVKDMFSSSGINMDTRNQCLLQKTLSLQERVNESQAALVLKQRKLETATKDADTAKAALQCRSCLTNEIDIALIPCGHVLCRPCSSPAVSCCPICGVQLSKTMKIYRP
ncbi:Histidine kinase-like ATPase, ATP-binding domain-containing protein [Artemisia annua]|uniref:Histidine kinase-like ATPase, ATP-binding domain-containing protein n=1 Tax=Artemisia annua TaxID=35608 RepID=A0A2U1P9M1_ARTAN|nr:Histidine kinase-like ATPase, ATP-binding domain-containing protein [Artemisia annua]